MSSPDHESQRGFRELPAGVRGLQARFYPDPRTHSPEWRLFEAVRASSGPLSDVLEMGAGPGSLNVHDLRRGVGRLVGVDLSERVATNPLLDFAMVADASAQPFRDNAFDVAFSLYVLEHVENPQAFCREVARVLRPGGVMLGLTPNRHHYVSAISRLTPHGFHEWIGRRRGLDEEDVVPTFYRLNSRRELRRRLCAAGFVDVKFEMVEVQPNYLLWNRLAFLLGAAYERGVNATRLLAGLRICILVSARLPS